VRREALTLAICAAWLTLVYGMGWAGSHFKIDNLRNRKASIIALLRRDTPDTLHSLGYCE
jgi:hypothetical protein